MIKIGDMKMDVDLILKKLGVRNIELYKCANELKELVNKNIMDIFSNNNVKDIEISSVVVYIVGWRYNKITQKRISDITNVSIIKIRKMSHEFHNYAYEHNEIKYCTGPTYDLEQYEMDLTQFKKNYSKVCPICNKSFKTGLPQSKYCSEVCSKKKMLQYTRNKNINILTESMYNKIKSLYKTNPKETKKLLQRCRNLEG